MNLKVWFLEKVIQGKLPMWIYRLIGKELAKKLNLTEENNMADEIKEDKPWYKSKAKWAGILTGVFAAIQPISTAFGHPYQVPLWLIELLTGLGIYGVRDAVGKIGQPPQS